MTSEPRAPDSLGAGDPLGRAAAAAAFGLAGAVDDPVTLTRLVGMAGDDPDPRVRAAALGALVRLGVDEEILAGAFARAASDPDPSVRRRAAELAPGIRAKPAPSLVGLLGDADPMVAEAAAFALGELADDAVVAGAVATLGRVAGAHPDALVREAAVAALGSLGDPAGLPAVLAALGDRPQIRRRAVLALAPFSGPEVEDALRHALDDRDWQVRQAAEDLLRPRG